MGAEIGAHPPSATAFGWLRWTRASMFAFLTGSQRDKGARPRAGNPPAVKEQGFEPTETKAKLAHRLARRLPSSAASSSPRSCGVSLREQCLQHGIVTMTIIMQHMSNAINAFIYFSFSKQHALARREATPARCMKSSSSGRSGARAGKWLGWLVSLTWHSTVVCERASQPSELRKRPRVTQWPNGRRRRRRPE